MKLFFWLSLLLIALSLCEAVKFPYKNGITLDSGAFIVGEYASLQCNFMKWKRERIQKVKWSVRYSGVTLPMFTSYFENPRKETNQNSRFFAVDESSSGHKVLRLRLNEARDEEVSVCCHVEGVSDTLYGSLRKDEKEKCIPILVIEGLPDVRLDVDSALARVGDNVGYECRVENEVSSKIEVSLAINGQDFPNPQKSRRLRSSFTVAESHFQPGGGDTGGNADVLKLECSARHKGSVLSNQTVLVTKDTRPLHESQRPKKTNPYIPRPYTTTTYRPTYVINTDRSEARKGRFYTNDQAHGSHGNVPCNSYIILEEIGQGSVIRGDLPLDIQSNIQDLRLNNHRYETGEETVEVLNILGFNGYRVVASTVNPGTGWLSWTLERKYYEFHSDGHF